jgi:SAM-dependent methyltransferase
MDKLMKISEMLRRFTLKSRQIRTQTLTSIGETFPAWTAYEPELVPPLVLMQQEGINVLEEWFRWAEEWSMILRVYGNITRTSHVLEIGCGLGRIAFPLRYVLSSEGSYNGFEICQEKVDFLTTKFHSSHPNFHFIWANVHNTFYNPGGQVQAENYSFPYASNSFDLVYAASVFTHLLPKAAENYFRETARVLKPNGQAIFSFFLLDNYRPEQPRPLGFARPNFNFEHTYGSYENGFMISNPRNPEEMTAYRLSLINHFSAQAGLEFAQAPVPGLWSGSTSTWVGAQDLIILRKPA